MELDLRFVDRVAGVGVEDLVAGVHQGEDELADHGFAAGLDGDVLSGVTQAVAGVDVGGQRFTQRHDAVVGAVAGLAVEGGLVGGLDDVARGGDVHIAQVEWIQAIAGGLELGGLCRNGKGGLGAQATQTFSDLAAHGRLQFDFSSGEPSGQPNRLGATFALQIAYCTVWRARFQTHRRGMGILSMRTEAATPMGKMPMPRSDPTLDPGPQAAGVFDHRQGFGTSPSDQIGQGRFRHLAQHRLAGAADDDQVVVLGG